MRFLLACLAVVFPMVALAQVVDYGPPTDAAGNWKFDLYDATNVQRGTTTNPLNVLSAQLPTTIGQKADAASLSVVISSGQAGALATNGLQTAGNNFLSQIATNTASALTDTVATGTIAALNGAVTLAGEGVYTTSVSILGTWSATLVAEGQLADNTWTILPMYAQNIAGNAQTVPYQVYYSTPANGVYLLTGGGYKNIRIRASAYTSGTVNVAVDGSLAQQTVFTGQLGTWTVNSVPVDGMKASYSTAVTGLVAGGATTDLFTLSGSATKTIRVTRIALTASQTTAAQRDVLIVKRSTANTGGTSTTPVAGSHDSQNPAVTAVARAYTANPTALGTLSGVIRSRKVFIATAATNSDEFILEWGNRPSEAVVLRGTNEIVAINLNGVAAAGSSFDISIEWTEE